MFIVATWMAWIALSIAAGMFASIRRNRSGFGWFVLALIMSPFLAFVFVAILKPLPEHRPPNVPFWKDFLNDLSTYEG